MSLAAYASETKLKIKTVQQISQLLNDIQGVKGFFLAKTLQKRLLHFPNDCSSRKVLTLGKMHIFFYEADEQ